MYPNVFQTLDVEPVRALLKAPGGPLRAFLFGQNQQQPPVYPYTVWRQIGGSPENYLGQRPDIDSFQTQHDVYVAASDPAGASTARTIAAALRDALESAAYVTAWIGDGRDPVTQSYVFTFQVDWLTPRA